jgi:two-component system NarL family response regulator
MSDSINVLLVDDHPAFRIGLASIISGQPDMRVIGQAGDGEAALRICAQREVHVVLMDLRLPGTSGIETTIELIRRFPSLKVLIVTTYDGDEDIHLAMQAGASGYVLKGLTSKELVTAIRDVHRGRQVIPIELITRHKDRVRRKDLSQRELDVLRLLVDGYTNKEIAHKLELGEETVKAHLKGVFIKLGVADRTQAAIAAVRHGIVHLE